MMSSGVLVLTGPTRSRFGLPDRLASGFGTRPDISRPWPTSTLLICPRSMRRMNSSLALGLFFFGLTALPSPQVVWVPPLAADAPPDTADADSTSSVDGSSGSESSRLAAPCFSRFAQPPKGLP